MAEAGQTMTLNTVSQGTLSSLTDVENRVRARADEAAELGRPRLGHLGRRLADLLSFASLAILLLPLVSWAATPTEEVRSLFAEAKKIIEERRPGDRPEEIEAAIAKIIRGRLAVRQAAESSLRGEWARLTEQQRDEFTRLFGVALEHRYMTAIKALIDITRGPRFVGEDVTGDSAVVRTILSGKDGQAKPFDLRLTKRASPEGNRWAIEDIVVEGVSLVENYRAQFTRILQERSHAALVELMRDKTAAMRLSPAPLTTTPGASALRDALFEPNDSIVRGSAKSILDEHAAWLKARGNVRVVIEGHADSRGAPALNRALAMARARAVRDYLVARGIDTGRLTTVSRGSEDSACAEPREECWAKNRRVHLRTE